MNFDFDYNHFLCTGNELLMGHGNPVQNLPVHPFSAAGYVSQFGGGGMAAPLFPPGMYHGYYPPPPFPSAEVANLRVSGGLPYSDFVQRQQLQTMPTPQRVFVPIRTQEESMTSQAKPKISFDVYDPGNFEAKLRKMIEAEGSCSSNQHVSLGHKDNDWATVKDITEPGVPKTSVMMGDQQASSQYNNQESSRCLLHHSKACLEHEREDAGKSQKKIGKRKREKVANKKNEAKKKSEADQVNNMQRKRKTRKQVTSATSIATNPGTTEISQKSNYKKTLVQQMTTSIQVFHKLGPTTTEDDSGAKKGQNLQTSKSSTTHEEGEKYTMKTTTLQHNEANRVLPKNLQHNTSSNTDDWSLMGFMTRMGLKPDKQ
ncbi:uncharacterized protein LOC143476822 [Brachyhypopomus gauderio]|uniref:uncharacterized protein LOC143476822 n=1 Tax=Brachyhypopomus gauderio TaxID=698409 RepID=UPI0040425CEC